MNVDPIPFPTAYNEYDEESRQESERRRVDLEKRTEAILANTPENILAPEIQTFVHKTIPDNTGSILEHGLRAINVKATATLLRSYTPSPELSEEENEATRIETMRLNAKTIASLHYQSTVAVVFQLPTHIPEQMPKYARKSYYEFGMNRTDFANAYLEYVPDWRPENDGEELLILPPRYGLGVINQYTGEFVRAHPIVRNEADFASTRETVRHQTFVSRLAQIALQSAAVLFRRS